MAFGHFRSLPKHFTRVSNALSMILSRSKASNDCGQYSMFTRRVKIIQQQYPVRSGNALYNVVKFTSNFVDSVYIFININFAIFLAMKRQEMVDR